VELCYIFTNHFKFKKLINQTLRKAFLLAICVFYITQIFCQDNENSRFLLQGEIISEEGKHIALAHIIDITSKTGVASDTLGYFKIWVNANNVLNISAIGFEHLEYNVESAKPDSLFKIVLQRKYYEIPEVSISYFGTYKDFEFKVLNLKLENNNKINELVLKELPKLENPKPYEPTLGSPISYLYDLLSHEGKSRRKYLEIKEEEPRKLKIEAKYNREIVKNITGLDGQELKEFMDTCNFSDAYLLATSDYLLYAEIIKKLDAFKKRNKIPEGNQ
jgi:hypothetical protein